MHAEVDDAIRKYLCWRTLVEAENALEMWRYNWLEGRPASPVEEVSAPLERVSRCGSLTNSA